MANALLNRHMQDLAAGDTLALALKKFSSVVLAAFQTATVFANHILHQTISDGKSVQFPATWKMTSESHTPGTELQGNNEPISEERIVQLNTAEDVAHAYFTTVDEFMQHFRPERAIQAGRANARVLDSRIARVIITGARQAARGPASEFPAGNVLTTPRTGPIATAYPISLAGSKALQDDLGEIAQKMDEKDVARDGRWAYITPYLERVLRQDKTILSRDFQDINTMLTRSVLMVEGFGIEISNQMPSSDVTAGTGEIYANYRGTFSTTVCCCTGDETAAGNVSFGGLVPFGPDWIKDKLSWLIGSRMLHGAKWLRPEACGEIAIA